ncbi:MAG: pyridoxal-5'-phosphate-dependent protein subunit beta [Acidobacteria bacterium OLB17]|nr:MAG: pyridoxal-5'-phosphate-dependent protein subunit beta [Acidobacteria bacterium OLB17]MCZ2391953.1 threonine/serine dehydratase [Acidobacteriota bacterium]
MKSLLEAIRPTTILEPAKLRDSLGLDLVVVSETFQHTGSFKFRAAYNVVLNRPEDEFIGVSSGNFGQALALACRMLGRKCTIVMPHNSAKVKVDAVLAYGAEADLINVNEVSRVERLEQLGQQRSDAYMASAFDDRLVIEGNSTLGDELLDLGLDAIIVPIGGGGLISGTVESFERAGKDIDIIGAEPLIANDAARSLKAGKIIPNEREPQTIADGTRTLSVGDQTFPVMQRGVKDVIEVTEENIATGLRMYFSLANLKCEPTGALSLGAVLQEPERFRGKRVAIVVSGGNVDADVYARLLSTH